jgi:hypothetical protein
VTDAALFAEAVAVAVDLAAAYAAWLLLLAAVGTLLLLAVVAAVGWLLRAAWRGVSAALRGAQGRRAPEPHPTHEHASGARTGVPSYEEAA